MIDFPGFVSAVAFTQGCNMRCPFCHNWELIHFNKIGKLKGEDVIDHLMENYDFLDALVISGGEPCIHSDLPEFLASEELEDFAIKLDTNGTAPGLLAEAQFYLDYIAMDIKGPPSRYEMCGWKHALPIQASIHDIINGAVDYEFRSTAVEPLINKHDIHEIGEMIDGAKRYALQQYDPTCPLVTEWSYLEPYTVKELRELGKIMESYVDEVIIRV